MKHIKRFNEDIICQEIVDYIQHSINESSDIKSIWDKAISKMSGLSSVSKRKVLTYLISSALTFSACNNVYKMISDSDMDKQEMSMAKKILDEKAKKGETEEEAKEKNNFDIGYEFSLSDQGKDSIKEHESVRLTAYSIGDGMISVGWGHAESPSRSKYRIGDKITQQEADRLFDQDIKVIEEGVRGIFKEWEEEGIVVKIDQYMFDALVSIAYNTGVGGLRKSKTISYLKSGDYKNAGESIKTLRVSKKFPGLAIRRGKESQMFLSGII